MYIYHALINVLSTHMMYINLNTMFYTHVEHSPTKIIYIRHYMEKHMHVCTHTRMHAHTYSCGMSLTCAGYDHQLTESKTHLLPALANP